MYQPSSQPTNLVAQPKNNTIILTWGNPTNTGGLIPSQFQLVTDDSGNQSRTNIMYNSNGPYSQTITNLTNKNSSYTFQLYLITGSGANQLNDQTATIAATPSGSPIVNSFHLLIKH